MSSASGLRTWIPVLFLCLIILAPRPARTEESEILVLVSRRIRPYLQAVDGLTQTLKAAGHPFQVIFIEETKGGVPESLRPNPAGRIEVAVGPEAGRLLKESSPPPDRFFFMMILDSENVFAETPGACGVSLRIPVSRQLTEIRAALPEIRRIGILFDPDHNSDFFSNARTIGLGLGLSIVPLEVQSRPEIPVAIRTDPHDVEAIWLIPDRTVITESVVQFIIKEALLRRTPVIGFNRFFYESGALLSFIIDYREVGRQTGRLVVNAIETNRCSSMPPEYRMWMNARVRRRLEVKIGDPFGGNGHEP
jgi:putative ABC transport system substrate-binding protein